VFVVAAWIRLRLLWVLLAWVLLWVLLGVLMALLRQQQKQ